MDKIANFKGPRRVYRVDELPKKTMGRVRKKNAWPAQYGRSKAAP
jgi:hypothetical protein